METVLGFSVRGITTWHHAPRSAPTRCLRTQWRSSAFSSCTGDCCRHGRRLRRLHDIPAFGAQVELVWRQRRYRCVEPACPLGGFSEDHPLAPAQAKLTSRAAWWAISCIQRDNT